MKKTKTYKIESSPLYRLRNKRKLANFLRSDLKFLNKVKADDYYKTYHIKQRNKVREIQEPSELLKQIQKRIKTLLQRLETPDWLISGKKGNSFVTNAKQHIGSRYVLTVDIENFYINSKREFVFKFFKLQMKMSENVAWLITDLVTYQGFIPTGSPTSQIIAYLSYAPTFYRIKNITDKYDCILSLYVDDLTISSKSSKKQISKKIPYLINNEFKKVSHQIKSKKTKFFFPYQNKIITGCCITPKGQLRVPNKMRLKIKKDEKVYLSNKKNENPARLLGRVLSARQIEPTIYKERYVYLKKQVFGKY